MARRVPPLPEKVPFGHGYVRREPQERAPGPALWLSSENWQRFSAQETDAHRLASARDAWLERLGPDLLLSFRHQAAGDALLAELPDRLVAYPFVPRRIFAKRLALQAPEREPPILRQGPSDLPLGTEIREAGLRYSLDFSTGYSSGFFIDQRANRRRLTEVRPRRLLNTFAYTCSFSVVAAHAGADTVSIDLSRRSLARGRENLARNGAADDPARHRLIVDDVLQVLPRLARRGETFDVIVLDPPTFSRNHQGEAFQVERDFAHLLALALKVAAPGAHLLLSTNHSGLRPADLERLARVALTHARRAGRFLAAELLPDFPLGDGARSVWLEL